MSSLVVWSMLVSAGTAPSSAQGTITTVAGGGIGDGGPATNARLDAPGGLFGTSAGLLLVTEVRGHRVRLVDEDGAIATLAGTGTQGYGGDGDPATGAELDTPADVCVGRDGSIYIADTGNNRVRRVDGDGIITTVAGGGESTADSVAALSASLSAPSGVTVDSAGVIYISDTGHARIVRVDTSGVLLQIAGGGSAVGDGGPALQAGLKLPLGLALDASGGLLIADQGDHRVRRIDLLSGVIETIAGTGGSGASGDGLTATAAEIGNPVDVAASEDGGVYIVERYNNRVQLVDAAGVVRTVAGTRAIGFSGDGGPAVEADLWEPASVFANGDGAIYIADRRNNRVRRAGSDGDIATAVGSGPVNVEVGTFFGDGAPATNAAFSDSLGVFVAGSGDVYIADSGNHRVRKIDASTGRVQTVAGTGEAGYSGDGSAAAAAVLNAPAFVFVDGEGNLLIADTGNHRIRKVDAATGVITTVAGDGRAGLLGDGSPATASHLNEPRGAVTDRSGHLFIADTGNNRIRRVDNFTGVITTFAGSGGIGIQGGFSGDGGAATDATLNQPAGLCFDAEGRLYIADSKNARIRRIDSEARSRPWPAMELPGMKAMAGRPRPHG